MMFSYEEIKQKRNNKGCDNESLYFSLGNTNNPKQSSTALMLLHYLTTQSFTFI